MTETPAKHVPDLPLILERMQDTIEALQKTVEEQHGTLAAHSRRIAKLEAASDQE